MQRALNVPKQLHLEHLAIFFSQHQFFLLKVSGYKKPLFKVFTNKDFLFKTGFEQMMLKYGVCPIRLISFRHFGASTINQWELKNHSTR